MDFWMQVFQILYLVQSFLGFGTAYRLTKRGGDNGVSLFGWLILMNLAAGIPGPGIYLWYCNKDV